MPASPPNKVLIIGSGPVRIGQPGAFDDAACRACEAFRSAGAQTVMIHCDPSALSADPETADRTYMAPPTLSSLGEILSTEKPDALLPSVGGPLSMVLAGELDHGGLLETHGVRLLGASTAALDLMRDPSALARIAEALGLLAPEGRSVGSMAEAEKTAEAIGYPVFVRTAQPADPLRQGIAYNVEELRQLASGGRLPRETIEALRIEQALCDHREVEVEMLRDAGGRIQVVAMAENMEPAGIHSGDSVAVIPMLTIEASTRRQIQEAAVQLADRIAATGSLHVKVAVAPDGNQVRLLSVNPCYSRMSAFCAKAFGIDLAAMHVRLIQGAGLPELLESEGKGVEGIMDGRTVAVRLPRWEFNRFAGEAARLDARMKSTGAVMGLGRCFAEAMQAAMRSRSPKHPLTGLHPELVPLPLAELMRRLVPPSPQRPGMLVEALKKGARPRDLSTATGIGRQWMRELERLANLETQLADLKDQPLPADLLKSAVQAGFTAAGLARLLDISVKKAAQLMQSSGIQFRPHASDDNDPPRVWFHAAGDGGTAAPHRPLGNSVLIVGPGSGRIGHGIELDHCCVYAARALKAAGRKTVMISANPAAANGARDFDRTYVTPLTSDAIRAVCHAEHPDGVILQFGGYAAMDLAGDIEDAGFKVLGTAPRQVVRTQERLQFSRLLIDMGIPHPRIGQAESPEQAMDLAEEIGYPLVVSVPSDRKRNRYTVVMDAHMLENDLLQAGVSARSPMLLEQFLEYAIEVEADALCDGKSVYVPAVMEHIELAGVHSGDVSMVVPPYSTPPRHVETMNAYVGRIALALGIQGVLNVRFAVLNDSVYMLAARPWACRTLPLVSKICDIPMAQRAVDIMLGQTLEQMDLPCRFLSHYGIRSSVFPFDTFPQSDPLLTPQMRSTGQAMTLEKVFGRAYYTSQNAAGTRLPQQGNLLITVTDDDKPSILEPARLFTEMGFGILATRGTHAFLTKNGIQAQLVSKLGFGRPDLVDAIKTGEVAIVVNTPSGRQSQQDDALIRKTAIRYNIPNITTPAGALAAAKGIAASKQGREELGTLQDYAESIR